MPSAKNKANQFDHTYSWKTAAINWIFRQIVSIVSSWDRSISY